MSIADNRLVRTLEQWSPIAFVVSGLGFLLSLALILVGETTAVTVSEMGVSVVTVPTIVVLSLVALPGFYPYVADASGRLALGGFVAAAVAGVSIALLTVASILLDLLGIIGFTEEGPLMPVFFLWMLAFFLSVLCYGVASLRTGEPSRVVGLLLLIIITEPGTTLLNDMVGLDLGIVLLYATLGIAGIGFLTVGYLLRSEYPTGDHREPASEMAA